MQLNFWLFISSIKHIPYLLTFRHELVWCQPDLEIDREVCCPANVWLSVPLPSTQITSLLANRCGLRIVPASCTSHDTFHRSFLTHPVLTCVPISVCCVKLCGRSLSTMRNKVNLNADRVT